MLNPVLNPTSVMVREIMSCLFTQAWHMFKCYTVCFYNDHFPGPHCIGQALNNILLVPEDKEGKINIPIPYHTVIWGRRYC